MAGDLYRAACGVALELRDFAGTPEEQEAEVKERIDDLRVQFAEKLTEGAEGADAVTDLLQELFRAAIGSRMVDQKRLLGQLEDACSTHVLMPVITAGAEQHYCWWRRPEYARFLETHRQGDDTAFVALSDKLEDDGLRDEAWLLRTDSASVFEPFYPSAGPSSPDDLCAAVQSDIPFASACKPPFRGRSPQGGTGARPPHPRGLWRQYRYVACAS